MIALVRIPEKTYSSPFSTLLLPRHQHYNISLGEVYPFLEGDKEENREGDKNLC